MKDYPSGKADWGGGAGMPDMENPVTTTTTTLYRQ